MSILDEEVKEAENELRLLLLKRMNKLVGILGRDYDTHRDMASLSLAYAAINKSLIFSSPKDHE